MSEGAALRVGLVVNPIAGMGGRVGLRGTDGDEALSRARELGAEPLAPHRANEASCILGESGIHVEVVEPLSREGTRSAARNFVSQGVDLILFVGGDGTARDIADAVGSVFPVLGIPSGVKMHSGVFATGVRSGAESAISWLRSAARLTREAEVVDNDESALRHDQRAVRLYGTLQVPDMPGRLQAVKASGGAASAAEADNLAREVVRRLQPGSVVILGAGTTIRTVGEQLGVVSTLLGTDVLVVNSPAKILAADANERAILTAISGREFVTAVLSPTGGQGFLLGRGNQQLSPAVIRAIGPENLLIVATPSKLAELGTAPLFVDTGDASLDQTLAGYRRVITGVGREAIVRVSMA